MGAKDSKNITRSIGWRWKIMRKAPYVKRLVAMLCLVVDYSSVFVRAMRFTSWARVQEEQRWYVVTRDMNDMEKAIEVKRRDAASDNRQKIVVKLPWQVGYGP